MSCPVTEGQLALFSSGDLGASDLSHISTHIAACPLCRQTLADFQQASDLLIAAFDEPDAYDLSTLRAAVRNRIEPSTRRFAWRWVLAAGVLLVAVPSFPVLRHEEAPPVVAEIQIPNPPLRQYRVQLDLSAPVRVSKRRTFALREPSVKAGLRNAELTATTQGKSELLIATADPNVLILLPMDKIPNEN
jgi:anti-sigma factor RsiW